MKILFVQKNLFPYVGIMSLSGYLQQTQHECFVFIDSHLIDRYLSNKIKDINPDLIGFSLLSTEHSWLIRRVKQLKEKFPKIPIVVGGVHAILYPEEIASIPEVDYVCYGEGELTLKQLLEHLELNRVIDEVGGIIFKKEGKIHKTPLNTLIAIDAFNEDRAIYYREYEMLRQTPMKVFLSSRGCIFKCAFCVNGQLQKRFEGLGSFVRRKPVERFISELEYTKINYGMKSNFIADDLFVLDKEWLKEFTILYKSKINVPFICTCRADLIDEESVNLLKAAGCHTVTFGVESGNEKIRTELLKKHISDEQLFWCAKLLVKKGIRFQTSNMFCLPRETIEDAIKTIDLNIKMGASFTMSAIFLPFPKTELANLCIRDGSLKSDYSFEDMPSSFITHSVLKLKDRDTLERLQKVAALIIQYPKLRDIFIFTARYIKLYSFHFVLYLIGTVLRFRAERKLSLLGALRYLWLYRRNV